ncbi:hypothetical protein [Beijerinckia indica]|uniref:Uncharacterized protein n=1 Tax=Beijerinckia indica subsp. indica (strain ATCC 9039 / DSM 1715 / NCIMB 8712) TaxID=395963 RepID=B2IEI2_BEII9|nr:hypothetical protein [Beijerinckia indica]ACB95580.1 hypothetical protein Bind_1957 [Beijerinckia indica subsp. indica ATCC 9039]
MDWKWDAACDILTREQNETSEAFERLSKKLPALDDEFRESTEGNVSEIQKWDDMTEGQKVEALARARASGARCARSACAGAIGYDANVLMDCSDYVEAPSRLQLAFMQGAQEVLNKRLREERVTPAK